MFCFKIGINIIKGCLNNTILVNDCLEVGGF